MPFRDGRGPFGDPPGVRNLSEEARSLARDVARNIAGEVRFDDGTRALYATDGSNYRQVPIGVVLPRSLEEIIEVMRAARSHNVPVLARGCGTSLAGQCCNTALIIDTSKYLNRVLEIDPERRLARVEPGTILDDLRREAEPYGLTFGPDPATHGHCTIGGMIGNNACGVHSVLAEFYGPGARTEDNVAELEVLTYDGLRLRVGRTSEADLQSIIRGGGRQGEVYSRMKSLRDRHASLIRSRFPEIPRRVSGYNLPQLLPEKGFHLAKALAGTESTCATILQATVNLIPNPRARALLILGYPSVFEAGDHVPEIRTFRPIGLEGIDDVLIHYMRKKGRHAADLRLLPEGGGWLLVEFGGDNRKEASDRARDAMRRLQKPGAPAMKIYDRSEEAAKVWEIRESAMGATAFVPGERDTWEGWEDSAVPPDRVGDYLRDLRVLLDRYSYHCSLYGHFGQGCIHTRIDFDLTTAEGIQKYRDFTAEAAELVAGRYGGSLSGEHGDGQARGDLLRVMFGEEIMQAFRDFKSAWDPQWKMNPGKVIDAAPRDRNLRLGQGYPAVDPPTHFRFPEDGGHFSHAALRCVGVGKCRRVEGGTMCPSFMVTREEKHTTRGRARLLFEMLHGDVITDGWKSEAVKDALDLCLACKGCKAECPVQIDMATYKAEFLSHYYEGRLRPRSAYAFGLIPWWSRVAAWMPGAANFFTQTPVLSTAAKWLAGVAPERRLPRFAPETFRQWFRKHRGAQPSISRELPSANRVILWPDTFNNHFHPETAQAALEVLEAAGFGVEVPQGFLCCGRPLYDYGMLDTAKRLLRKILDHLRPELDAGIPIVVLEPSCAAVFRDELTNLFPEDPGARRLRDQTFLLSEFLQKKAPDFSPPRLEGKALVQGHCHQKALMGMEDELALLSRLGLDGNMPDSGCCGMAGAFGFERGERFEVSIKAGERVLLPAVRAASKDTLIVADGFSCREQIRQATDREALHLSQILQMALTQEGRQLGDFPESLCPGTLKGAGEPPRSPRRIPAGFSTTQK